MKRFLAIMALTAVVLATPACTDSKRARNATTWGDKPADVTCWTYGTQNFAGRSTGKVEYDEGGRISFVDAANGRYTTIEGECRVVYVGDDQRVPPNIPASAPTSTPEA